MDSADSGDDDWYCTIADYEIKMIFADKIHELILANSAPGDDQDTGEDDGVPIWLKCV